MEVLKEATKAGADAADVTALVAGLISQVRAGGDAALLELTQKFDGVALEGLEVPPSAMKDAYDQVGAETVATLLFAAEQLRTFAAKQLECFSALRCESLPGSPWGTGSSPSLPSARTCRPGAIPCRPRRCTR